MIFNYTLYTTLSLDTTLLSLSTPPLSYPFLAVSFLTDVLYGVPSAPLPPNTTNKPEGGSFAKKDDRSEEHTSELQSRP